MGKYRRMTYTDRLTIEKLYNSGCSLRTIARKTGFAVSSIHYEIKRGMYLHRNYDWKDIPRYSADRADADAKWNATAKGSTLKIDKRHDYADFVSHHIRKGQSPDQIVGRLRESNIWTVSTPTLYRYIDMGIIPGITNKDLWDKAKRRRRTHHQVRPSRPPAGVSIERRQIEVDSRTTFGHWEMDTVIGRRNGTNQALLVLTERKTRYEIICKLPNRTTAAVEHALQKVTSQLPQATFQTITVDNGSEFSNYDGIRKYTQEVYYCHPYSSWERGSNENANRLIRRFYPKGTSFEFLTQKDCDALAHYMNNMPRKILNYRTAAEVFAECISVISCTP